MGILLGNGLKSENDENNKPIKNSKERILEIVKGKNQTEDFENAITIFKKIDSQIEEIRQQRKKYFLKCFIQIYPKQ